MKQNHPVDLHAPSLFINRELSWLEFNKRVLLQTLDEKHPLLERVKFLSIVGTNLDEFYMVRVATLLRKFRNDIEDVSPDGLNTSEELAATQQRPGAMLNKMGSCLAAVLRPLLEERQIRFLEPDDYTDQTRRYLTSHFRDNIHPVLTPLASDPGHPFPFISNLSVNLAVAVRHNHRTRFARVKLPDVLSRFIQLPKAIAGPDGETFVFLEDVVKANIGMLFPGAHVLGAHLFRIIRDTDMVIQEYEADDLIESVDRTLKQLRYGDLSQLLVESAMPARVLSILIEIFEIEDDILEKTSERMGFGDIFELTRLHHPQLKDPLFSPHRLWVDDDVETIFDQIRERDHLVHHPFDSFTSAEAFLQAVVEDPHVSAIKMTPYRIGSNSPLIDLLIQAAEAGKPVVILVELKARFDEKNNIAWAHRLESTGIHVVYGLLNLKTHCKLCLVIRRKLHGIVRYVRIGTGNYNRATAQVYTDLGLFTARRGQRGHRGVQLPDGVFEQNGLPGAAGCPA